MVVTVIVSKMYAFICKKAWSWLRTFVGRKNATVRGARPDHFPQISAGGFPVWSSALAAADGMQHEATAGTTRATEAQRCYRPSPGSNSAHKQKHNDIHTPRAYTPTICSGCELNSRGCEESARGEQKARIEDERKQRPGALLAAD